MPKLKLNCWGLFDCVRSMMKTIHDNNVVDHTIVPYDEINNKLSLLIELAAVCDKNKIGQ